MTGETGSNETSAMIDGRSIVVSGRWIKIASVHDEYWVEGEVVKNPELTVQKIKEAKLDADIFVFSQKMSDQKPKYSFHFEWDNAAVIPIIDYATWWENRLSRKARQEVTRSERLGVTIKCVEFDDHFLGEVVEIFSKIRLKQGKAFSHHGKDRETVKKEVSTFSDKSQFIAAYFGNELIGYLKLVFLDGGASILNIITNDAHYDKRPANVLLARAVKICEERKLSHLLYGKYTYGNKTGSSLTEFKRRNGFEKVLMPRYYIPLRFKGRVAMKLKLHLGALGILPPRLISLILRLRSFLFRLKMGSGKQEVAEQASKS